MIGTETRLSRPLKVDYKGNIYILVQDFPHHNDHLIFRNCGRRKMEEIRFKKNINNITDHHVHQSNPKLKLFPYEGIRIIYT